MDLTGSTHSPPMNEDHEMTSSKLKRANLKWQYVSSYCFLPWNEDWRSFQIPAHLGLRVWILSASSACTELRLGPSEPCLVEKR